MSQTEIDAENLTHVVNTRREKKGIRPGLTCPAITGGPKVRAEDTSWLPASRQPTASELRRMVGCLVKCAVKLVMNNHFYSFNNEIRRQRKGGAIGNSQQRKSQNSC